MQCNIELHDPSFYENISWATLLYLMVHVYGIFYEIYHLNCLIFTILYHAVLYLDFLMVKVWNFP